MLSTKGIKTESKTPKTLQPGNLEAHVYDIQLVAGYNPGSYNLLLFLEGKPVGESFEGFFKDKNDQSQGRFLGQVGRVKFSKWAAEDKTVNNSEISRDQTILRYLMSLAKAQGTVDALNEVEADSIEDFVEKAKAILCNETYVHFCIGGREYTKDGYVNYDLHLVKPAGKKYPVADNAETVVTFEPEKHIEAEKKKVSEPVTDFGPATPADEPFKF